MTAPSHTAYQDQLRAASVDAVMSIYGQGARVRQLRELPDWPREHVVAALERFQQRTVRLCKHRPSPFRPQPVYAALWRPNLIVCGKSACLDRLNRAHVPTACDRCGATGGVSAIGAGIDQLSLAFDLCVLCADAMGVPA